MMVNKQNEVDTPKDIMNGGVQMQKWRVDNILQVSWALHETMN
jgi:hypothetical protein